MWRRILAIFVARNREFYRDKAGLGWNIIMPFLMVFGFAFIFADDRDDLFTIGVLTPEPDLARVTLPFLDMQHLDILPLADPDSALAKVERHQIDLLVDPEGGRQGELRYWVNQHSARGYLAERLLQSSYVDSGVLPQRQTVTGRSLRYVDWVLPGVLGMNIMFSSLWGVGWVIVRYRKNGVLRRLKATPLTAFEFIAAQLVSGGVSGLSRKSAAIIRGQRRSL